MEKKDDKFIGNSFLIAYGVVLFLMVVASVINFFFEKRTVKYGVDVLPVELQLKAPIDKIIYAVDKDDLACVTPLDCINNGKIKEYAYVSDEISNEKYIFKKGDYYSNTVEVLNKDGKTKLFVYSRKMAKRIGVKNYKIISGATTTIEAFNLQVGNTKLNLYDIFATEVNADSISPISASGDGRVDNDRTGTTWTAVRDGSTGTSNNETTPGFSGEVQVNSTRWAMYRSYMPFDTSALPDSGITITAVSLFAKTSGTVYDGDNDGLDYIGVATTTQASISALENTDWGLTGDTLLSSKHDLSDMVTTTWYEFVLTQGGIDEIVADGYTKLGLREGHDLENIASDAGYGSYIGTYWYMSETTGSEPYLEITYASSTPPAEEVKQIKIPPQMIIN